VLPEQISMSESGQTRPAAVHREFAALSANPNAIMITPMVMEIIAEKAGTAAGDAIVPGAAPA
jgi:hypothetical protein